MSVPDPDTARTAAASMGASSGVPDTIPDALPMPDAPVSDGASTSALIERPASRASAVPGAPSSITQRSLVAVREPPARLVLRRGEDPSPARPVSYRELRYVVGAGTSRESLEVLLWARYHEVVAELEPRLAGKYVQILVYEPPPAGDDHPPTPVASLIWKDWRGSPVVQINEPTPAPQAADAPVADIATTSADPVQVVDAPAGVLAPAANLEPLHEAPSLGPISETLPPPSYPLMQVEAASDEDHADIAALLEEGEPESALPRVVRAPTTEPPPAESADVDDPTVPLPPPVQRSHATLAPPSSRRAPGEDLIGELFEAMHELHFLPDMVGGVEFVLDVLARFIPCELMIVHVFDINQRRFVVVRARGPGERELRMAITDDRDPLFALGLRRAHALRIDRAAEDPRFRGGRWERTPVCPRAAVFGPVHQHGRFLGAIELVNPRGTTPFYESEAHALEYVCEQLAGFLSQRPLVLERDVVDA